MKIVFRVKSDNRALTFHEPMFAHFQSIQHITTSADGNFQLFQFLFFA